MTDDDFAPAAVSHENVMTVADDRFAPGNVAIVTGAASGIGRATAVALAANGLTVLATDLDEDGLADAVERADEIGVDGSVETHEADLTNDDDIEGIVDAAAELGDVRFVANIAGLQHIDPIDEFPVEKFDLMHQVMLRAPFLLAKHAMPHIRESGSEAAGTSGTGAIGNMASIHGHTATEDKAAYISAKFGLRGLTQAIAAEGDGTLRAFSVSTGYVKTPLVTEQIPDTAAERGISEQEVVEDVMLGDAKVKEMMEPVEVANLFVLGFSEHARHLDGGDLTWDGGHLYTY
ncbi:SDR family oxidoreductase [Halorubellus sp. JP-L1]|uniref:SDR family oxidoreductase n=1 Tax=Halorubellus sp. JP-L1 TaxID=2715753 RepID=UPI00140B3F6B|nr:SDR family oxidoreductase [Halorubellus sp. JP-L1]NHN43440.1 SDR family oxidoreductase [Halorubellus sp. JP-L1]